MNQSEKEKFRKRLIDLEESQGWVHDVVNLNTGQVLTSPLNRPVTPLSRAQRLSQLGDRVDPSIFGWPRTTLVKRIEYLRTRLSAAGVPHMQGWNALSALAEYALTTYRRLLAEGVAPECARAVLPEGLTPTRLYMHGTLRSWLHYLKERLHVDPKRGVQVAQREHVLLAEAIYDELRFVFPTTFAAVEQFEYIDRGARERLA